MFLVEENTKTVVTSEAADKEQIKTQINGDIGEWWSHINIIIFFFNKWKYF